MNLLLFVGEKRPRVVLPTGAVADDLYGGVDMGKPTCAVAECDSPAHSRGWCQAHYGRWHRHGDPHQQNHASVDTPTLERILSRIEVGDCWLWTGAISSGGYARINFDGKTYGVHRVIWEELVGPIPEGYQIDHLCRVRHCVNPDHLEPVTQVENIRRGHSTSAQHAKATECVNGHPFDERNTYTTVRGWRNCRACKAMYERRRRARLREQA